MITPEQHEIECSRFWQRAFCAALLTQANVKAKDLIDPADFADQALLQYKKSFPPPIPEENKLPNTNRNIIIVLDNGKSIEILEGWYSHQTSEWRIYYTDLQVGDVNGESLREGHKVIGWAEKK